MPGCGLNISNAKPTLSINELAKLQNLNASTISLEDSLAHIMNTFEMFWDQFLLEGGFDHFLSSYLSNWIHAQVGSISAWFHSD